MKALKAGSLNSMDSGVLGSEFSEDLGDIVCTVSKESGLGAMFFIERKVECGAGGRQ